MVLSSISWSGLGVSRLSWQPWWPGQSSSCPPSPPAGAAPAGLGWAGAGGLRGHGQDRRARGGSYLGTCRAVTSGFILKYCLNLSFAYLPREEGQLGATRVPRGCQDPPWDPPQGLPGSTPATTGILPRIHPRDHWDTPQDLPQDPPPGSSLGPPGSSPGSSLGPLGSSPGSSPGTTRILPGVSPGILLLLSFPPGIEPGGLTLGN